MALFIIYSDSQTGQPKTVLRYGECPDDHVSSQANTGEIAVAVSEAQTGNFIGAAAIVEDPPETGGAFWTPIAPQLLRVRNWWFFRKWSSVDILLVTCCSNAGSFPISKSR